MENSAAHDETNPVSLVMTHISFFNVLGCPWFKGWWLVLDDEVAVHIFAFMFESGLRM